MIVHSNAFVFSTCLPEMVYRYGYIFIVFPEPLYTFKGCYYLKKIFSSFSPLGLINLEAVTCVCHKLKAR